MPQKDNAFTNILFTKFDLPLKKDREIKDYLQKNYQKMDDIEAENYG